MILEIRIKVRFKDFKYDKIKIYKAKGQVKAPKHMGRNAMTT